MRRPRGPGGRFLTAEEIAAQQKAAASSDSSSLNPNPNPSAEERKAKKAVESATVAGLDGARGPEESFGPLSDVLAGNGRTSPGRNGDSFSFSDGPSVPDIDHGMFNSYPVPGIPQLPSSIAHVQFSDLSGGPSSGTGLH